MSSVTDGPNRESLKPILQHQMSLADARSAADPAQDPDDFAEG